MKSTIAAIAALPLLLTACAGNHPPKPQMPFIEAEYSVYSKPGTATITGQAFLTQNGGGVVTCAGREVFLMPATNYFMNNLPSGDNRVAELYNFSAVMHAMPHQEYVRTAVCDAQGNFQFDKLTAAKWIVMSNIVWQVSGINGGAVRGMAETKNAQTSKLLLSNGNIVFGM